MPIPSSRSQPMSNCEGFVLASSHAGKLREYQELASGRVALELLPNFLDVPAFEESAPTFAENAAGKAVHYSSYTQAVVLADDSGLVVPALGGAPGVESARYAGPNATDTERYRKLLQELTGIQGQERRARFVCVIAFAQAGRALAIVSDAADGIIIQEPRGSNGFGYDPVFLFPQLGRTFAELTAEEKNLYSHRGKAFRKAVQIVLNPAAALSL